MEAALPSKSEKQKRLMAASAHDPKFAKKVGIPQSVAKDFVREDAKVRRASMARALMGAK